ncbi:MAG: hypothetical protein M3Z35_01865, partial [Nitrospirota bacterium]|nr:hypothetical protein [Nitrospirota bacterium]
MQSVPNRRDAQFRDWRSKRHFGLCGCQAFEEYQKLLISDIPSIAEKFTDMSAKLLKRAAFCFE